MLAQPIVDFIQQKLVLASKHCESKQYQYTLDGGILFVVEQYEAMYGSDEEFVFDQWLRLEKDLGMFPVIKAEIERWYDCTTDMSRRVLWSLLGNDIEAVFYRRIFHFLQPLYNAVVSM
mgnify:CR=1 FL=1